MLAWSVLLPVLPLFIRGPLGGGDVTVGVLTSGAMLAAAAIQPLLGGVADRSGRRLLLIGGPLVFGAFVALFSVVAAPLALFAARVAAGIGDAAFVVGALTVVNDLAPESRRGEAYNVYSLAIWAGMGLGPVVGDLALRISFDTVWMVCAVLSVAGALTGRFLPETRRAPATPWTMPALFSRPVALPGLALGLEIFGYAALLVFSPLYARELGMQGAGLVLAVNAVVLIAMRVFGRRLPDRLGPRRSAMTGLCFVAVGLALPAVLTVPAGLYLSAAGFGVGHALLYPAILMLAVRSVPEEERSAALGSLKACEAIGMACGAAVLGLAASLAGYGAVFAIAGAAAALAFVPLLLSPERHALVGTPAAAPAGLQRIDDC
jgi:MFS family permease